MKHKYRILLYICTIIASTQLISCGVDRWPEYAAQTAQDEWIDSIMRKNYLWYREIPKSNVLNYFSPPTKFIQSLLYKAKDNLYSSVDTIITTPLPTYGYGYSLQKVPANDTAYYALVSYVLPNSPASSINLKRGDWIMKVNDTFITRKTENQLLNSGENVELLLGKYEIQPTDEENSASDGIVVSVGSKELPAIRPVEIKPIYKHSVITTANGVKLGYLVYNRFENGSYTQPQIYADELRAISNYFAVEKITHFALDLRYNTGGVFEASQLIASIIAPSTAVNAKATYAQLTFNDLQPERDGSITYNSEIIGSGSNLNIQQGFIITSAATSPSVTGVFLNCLTPLKRWALIGSAVKCWGYGTEVYTDPRFNWGVKPVVCEVANSEGETGIDGSFTPNITVNELSNFEQYLPLGDPNELLLSKVIGIIEGTINPE